MDYRTLLERAGQPLRRTRAWTYCVKKSGKAGAAAVLTPQGKVALVASDAPGYRLGGVSPGDGLADLPSRVKRIGGGVWTTRLGKSRIGYLVKNDRVRMVAVGGPGARSPKKLRQYLSLVPSKGMKARSARVKSRRARRLTSRNAVSLVHQQDPHRLAFYCTIGL
jgi:hypothetical protein